MLVSEAAWLLTDVTHGLSIVDVLLTKTQSMQPALMSGPLPTITDPDLADRVPAVIAAIRAELAAFRERYGTEDESAVGT